MYAVKHTQVLANHSSGRLLQSLQSTMPIQTARSDEGVKNRTENSLLLLNYVFWCKNIDNILSGHQITVQNKKQRQLITPLKEVLI